MHDYVFSPIHLQQISSHNNIQTCTGHIIHTVGEIRNQIWWPREVSTLKIKWKSHANRRTLANLDNIFINLTTRPLQTGSTQPNRKTCSDAMFGHLTSEFFSLLFFWLCIWMHPSNDNKNCAIRPTLSSSCLFSSTLLWLQIKYNNSSIFFCKIKKHKMALFF